MGLLLSEIGYCLILLRKPRNFFITIAMTIGGIMFIKIVDGILDCAFMVMVVIASIIGTLIVGL
jgi:hypothetical protein